MLGNHKVFLVVTCVMENTICFDVCPDMCCSVCTCMQRAHLLHMSGHMSKQADVFHHAGSMSALYLHMHYALCRVHEHVHAPRQNAITIKVIM